MTQTDMASVTCSAPAIVGRATFAIAASSTTSTMAANTEAIASDLRGPRGTELASSDPPVERLRLE